MKIQLCNGSTQIQLCEGSTKIQLCEEHSPCTCPCGTWPPEAWPCGGLNETYAYSVTFRYRHWTSVDCSGTPDVDCTRTVTGTITADPAHTCVWGPDFPDLTSCPAPDVTAGVLVYLAGCDWRLDFDIMGYASPYALKSIGATLAGTYTPHAEICRSDGGAGSFKLEIMAASVS